MNHYWASTRKILKGGKFGIADRLGFKGKVARRAEIGRSGAALKRFAQELKYYVVQTNFKGEALPMPANQVKLSRHRDRHGIPLAKVQYHFHKHDIALLQFARRQFDGILAAVKYIPETLETRDGNADPLSPHLHGTLRFGLDPETSVLNADCMCHWVRGLYCVDASFMPTSGGGNTTFTVIANAIRVANIVFREYRTGGY
jgi:choline dehydrogenase-like flavoprotein